MEVSHPGDFDTHAVIGGREVMGFQMASTAEFFTVLSSALYSDKPLAVVREVLCNAWDSHKVSGITNTAVDITINDDKLVIRDYGKGIDPVKMHGIYCIYGASTKVNSEVETGGFGLGSKAPFAYTDHFTVITHYDGLKTVYAVSRGSAMTKGVPDFRIMVQVPTTETGIEVSIPLKTSSDQYLFKQLAEYIASFGEMNVNINGNKVETKPISQAEDFFLYNQPVYNIFEQILIRYGNIIYPIPHHNDYYNIKYDVEKFLKELPTHSGKPWKLILEAPPNSISVTPSRESLSLTETTVESIKQILKNLNINSVYNNEVFKQTIKDKYNKTLDELFMAGKTIELFWNKNIFLSLYPDYRSEKYSIINKEELVELHLASNQGMFGKDHPNRKNIINNHLTTLIKNNWRRKEDIIKFQNLFNEEKFKARKIAASDTKRIFRPIINRVYKDKNLHLDNLMLSIPYGGVSLHKNMYPIKNFSLDKTQVIPLLSGVIFIASSKIQFNNDYALYPIEQLIPSNVNKLVYITSNSKIQRESAINLFTKMGYFIVDLIEYRDRHNAKHPKVMPEPKVKVPKILKDPGLVLLSHNLQNTGFYKNGHTFPDAPRSLNYQYIIKPYNLKEAYMKRFFPWGDRYAKEIVELFGSNIGVVVNSVQWESELKKGKKPAIPYIEQSVLDYVNLHKQKYLDYYSFNNSNKDFSVNAKRILAIATKSNVLNIVAPKSPELNQEEMYYRDILQHIAANISYYSPKDIEVEIKNLWIEISNAPGTDEFDPIFKMIDDSNLIRLLNLHEMKIEYFRAYEINDYDTMSYIEISIMNALKL